MQYLQVSLILCSLILISESVSVRVFWKKCNEGGFSCFTNPNKKLTLTYQCPEGVDDATIYIGNFQAPANTETFIVQNCQLLQFSFLCHDKIKFPVTELKLINITNLQIIPSMVTLNPVTVHFENITRLEHIPENTFWQVSLQKVRPTCSIPQSDLSTISFKNVNIGSIAPRAFSNLTKMVRFNWTNVSVESMQHSSVQVDMDDSEDFSIMNSNIEVAEHLAFQVRGKKAQFLDNKFKDISSSAINGTIESFKFLRNTVNNFQSYGISILSQNVEISENRFEYLRSGALQKISPGLLQNSQKDSDEPKFSYKFDHNVMNYLDAGSLNPDMTAYENVTTDLQITRNVFYCTCKNIGWIFFDAGHGYSTLKLQKFHEIITDAGNSNTCSDTSCQLPLNESRALLKDGKCVENLTAESLCNLEKTTVKPDRKLAFKVNAGIGLEVCPSMIVILLWICREFISNFFTRVY